MRCDIKIKAESVNIAKKAPKLLPFNKIFFRILLIYGLFLSSCEHFFEPDQALIIEEEDMYSNWTEYRSQAMGLYSLQQKLVDQILVLGELRGDLVTVTEFATPDLVEVQNFNITKDNPYASPVNFYKLIGACNDLIVQLKTHHSEVLDKDKPINNYDRLFGEALCMRAWAYFNAARIYGKIPYIYESLTDADEIENYVNSEARYVDSVYISFAPEGYYNDTIRDTIFILEKKFIDQKAVIDTFSSQLESMVKAVGVNYSIDNLDFSWSATTWSDDSRHALLGQMYLFDQNYTSAMDHFYLFLDRPVESGSQKYGLDSRFSLGNWKNIFIGIDPYEHIYTLWFNKSYQQTNNLQVLFSVLPPNQYMLKPTSKCIKYWESIWDGTKIKENSANPALTKVEKPGKPGDFYRGYGVSYKYYKNGEELSVDTVKSMLLNKLAGSWTDVEMLMSEVDTVVNKYSINKNEFAHDANFIIYRAAGIHLYAAEIFTVWEFIFGGLSTPRTQTNSALNILNYGYEKNAGYSGIRGRVGFAEMHERILLEDIIYLHDSYTNEIIGYLDYTGDFPKKQAYLMDMILEEKAREMAFEGERFYDLVRIAKRNNDPSFLANRIAEKFTGTQKETIRQKLMDERNWYVNFYE